MKERHKYDGWLLTGGRSSWRAIVFAVLLGTAAAGCAAALMFTSGELISRSTLRPENVLMVYVPIVLVRTFGLGRAAFQYAERLAGHHAALTALSAMRIRLYHALESQAMDLRSRYRLGELLGLAADDIERLQQVYLRIVFPALSGVLVYGTTAALLSRSGGAISWWLIAYGGLWLFIVPLVSAHRARTAHQRVGMQRSLFYSDLSDAWSGLTDWVLSGRTQQAVAALRVRQTASAEREKASRAAERGRQWLARSAAGGAVLLIIPWVVGRVEAGVMESVWIAACVLAVFPIMDSIVKVNDALARWPDFQDSFRRLAQTETARPDTAKCGNSTVSAAFAGLVYIKLERLGYRYSVDAEPALKGIDLELPQGKKIAVLGRSGAGKSTLLQVLSGQREAGEGTMTINGSPMSAQQKRQFSILNQQPHLFHTTIANNVRMGRKDATDEEIRDALRQVGLQSLVAALPKGVETPMEEAGSRFSGGERQRVALSRILLQASPIVLLDEPTTGLDRPAELALIQTLLETLRERTIVWFTHRLTMLEKMDEILFLERGEVRMRGTHRDLSKREDRYRKWYELDRF